MMLHPRQADERRWNVLLSSGGSVAASSRLAGLEGLLAPASVSVRRTDSEHKLLACIENGGVDAAVLWAEAEDHAGLRMLERVRAVSAALPCLLVAAEAHDATIRRAFELQAYSVLRQPVEVTTMADLLIRILRRQIG